jgi:aspartate carbamoyltransferase catalytic subunit
MSHVQIDADGRLRHLITLQGLERSHISGMLDRAVELREAFSASGSRPQLLAARTVVNLFFEPSTRTRSSFELAARRLGANVLNFDISGSSTSKGESLEDTLATLEAMQADAFIVRHKENGTPERLARHAQRAAILNAGDGNHAHPTQGLLDALTIRDRHPDPGLTESGDLRGHSPLARGALRRACAQDSGRGRSAPVWTGRADAGCLRTSGLPPLRQLRRSH